MIEAVVKADELGMTGCEILAVNEDGTYKIQRTDLTVPSDGIGISDFWAECDPDMWEFWQQ